MPTLRSIDTGITWGKNKERIKKVFKSMLLQFTKYHQSNTQTRSQNRICYPRTYNCGVSNLTKGKTGSSSYKLEDAE